MNYSINALGGVLQRRGGELIGVIVAEVEVLQRGERGVVLLPGRDLAVDSVRHAPKLIVASVGSVPLLLNAVLNRVNAVDIDKASGKHIQMTLVLGTKFSLDGDELPV